MKQEEEERLVLESNPLEWSVTDVVRFIKLTDCAPLAKIFQEQVRASVLGLLCQLAWSQPHQGGRASLGAGEQEAQAPHMFPPAPRGGSDI